jgi:hypothetical protein
VALGARALVVTYGMARVAILGVAKAMMLGMARVAIRGVPRVVTLGPARAAVRGVPRVMDHGMPILGAARAVILGWARIKGTRKHEESRQCSRCRWPRGRCQFTNKEWKLPSGCCIECGDAQQLMRMMVSPPDGTAHVGTGLGIDLALEKIHRSTNEKNLARNQKYRILWDQWSEGQISLEDEPLDCQGRLAASRYLVKLPVGAASLEPGMCQDGSTPLPSTDGGRKILRLFHATPLTSVPSILQGGLNCSRRSHNLIVLWLRDFLADALPWCCLPQIQRFPCVVFEIEVQANSDDTIGYPIAHSKKRTEGAFCVQVPAASDAASTELLPPVALKALWVALPSGRLHQQAIADVHQTCLDVIARLLGEEKDDRGKGKGKCKGKGKEKGEGKRSEGGRSKANTWGRNLIQMTERRLAYWGLGSEERGLQQVPWPRATISEGLLSLSLDVARCLRAAGGDTGASAWTWARVLFPFREWLCGQGVGPTRFSEKDRGNDVPQDVLAEWSAWRDTVRAPSRQRDITAQHVAEVEHSRDVGGGTEVGPPAEEEAGCKSDSAAESDVDWE